MNPVNRTLHAFLTEYAARCPDRKLLGGPAGWKTAAQILDSVETLARELCSAGLRKGDFVALRAYRKVETAMHILALQVLGAVTVLTDPRHGIESCLNDCQVQIPVAAMIDGSDIKIVSGRQGREPAEADVDPQAPGFVIFTSGSTGKPKAVLLSQYNLVNNLLDSRPLGCYREDDIALGILPMDHVFGLVLLAGVCVLGYGLYLQEEKNIPAILETIETQGITRMNGVPSLYLAMAEQAGAYDLSTLRAGFIGGGPCTAKQFVRMERELGMTLVPVYGMSEFVGVACGSWRDDRQSRSSGIGPFYSMNTGKILLDDGTEAPPGQTGEICVDGPSRMVGYFGDDTPREPLWHTGDMGYLDDRGILHLTGRKKDIIIRNGINLSSRKIEEALLLIPGVTEAAVVGLPDENAGELPWAMVVCTRSIDFEAGLAEYLHKNEIPAGLCIVDVLPKTAAGKLDKQTIREVLEKWKA